MSVIVTTRRVVVRCGMCDGTGQQPHLTIPLHCTVCHGKGHYRTTETVTTTSNGPTPDGPKTVA